MSNLFADFHKDRRKYKATDMYCDIDRFRKHIYDGYFGELSYEQMGKMTMELYLIERTFRTFIIDNIIRKPHG